jgi:hypothetical protein
MKERTFAEYSTGQNVPRDMGRTRIVFSFGAGGGGALFAQWLRRELMRALGLTEPNAVFIDTVALSEVPGTTLKMCPVLERRPGGKAGIANRFYEPLGATTTAGGLASMNGQWHDHYIAAMEQAQLMIFVLTSAWLNSWWCLKELGDFVELNTARMAANANRPPGERRPPLRAVALCIDGEVPFSRVGHFGMTGINARRAYVVEDEAKRAKLTGNYKDFWLIDDAAYYRLLAEVALVK